MPKLTKDRRPAKFREEPKKIIARLSKALDRADPAAAFPPALLEILQEYGMTSVAEKAGIRRETLYRSLGGKHRAPFDHVVNSMAAIGFKFVVVPREI